MSLDTWSVADLTEYIRQLFEIDFRLQEVSVEGEISNFTHARSGHLYFTLKDSSAQIKCVMWRSAAERLRFAPQEGDAVICEGRVSVYETAGAYQLYVERMRNAGIGALAQQFEQLKQKLADEGLFSADYKQPLPPFPQQIGIVTSLNAAALRDMVNVLHRRYPVAEVVIAPTLVQGATAPPQIVSAIQKLDAQEDIDLIVVARGGGSIEDLWAFNDEGVARAIFSARHPIISGVGHETDFTIADFVADVRAPTPSAAVELATPDMVELLAGLIGIQNALNAGIHNRITQHQQQLTALKRHLTLLSPRTQLDSNRQRLDMLALRLEQAIQQQLQVHKNQLQLAQARLDAGNPQAILGRGYAIVRREDGAVVRSVAGISPNDPLQIQLADGQLKATVQAEDS